ncbi:Calmodulin-binding transcription activator 3 [Sesamum angolense]|uniref:Calmodulin-binding transcription activator 3 n=1 Tax=Sesamum angolense TaxID=2727404 RepID=A0AAE1W158_9LAMI|nr:Calmodulin-binding transcription activator 3 [Sesamum angolense]
MKSFLCLACLVGYDWAIPLTVAAGVNVNFRDANGWTALLCAAYYGRERTLVFVIFLGAAPEALTDPTPKYPAGRPPAELAASKVTKASLERNDRGKAVETVTERIAIPAGYGDLPHGMSMEGSLAFRKQHEEYGDGEFGISDERALSPLALKTKKAGRHDEPLHAAAAVYDKVVNNHEVDCDDDLIGLEALLDNDTLMQKL